MTALASRSSGQRDQRAAIRSNTPTPSRSSPPSAAEGLLLGKTGATPAEERRLFSERRGPRILELKSKLSTHLRARVDFRFEFQEIGQRALRVIDAPSQPKRRGEPQRKLINTRVAGPRLREQIYRL